jgi:DNA-binding GntR family transcriptional regulator
MNSLAREVSGAGLPAHEIVFRQLREMVLFGDLAPGEPVTIQGLVERTGAGMTPVREGLRRLTAAGALEAQGNRRIMVPVLSVSAVEEMTEARVALEPVLARKAVPNCGAAEIAALAATDARLDAAIARGDIPGYLRENHQFHQQLNALAEAPILTALVEGLWLRFGPSLRMVCGQVGTRNLPDRHKELLAALRDKDVEAAAQAIAEDVVQGMRLIADDLRAGKG